MVKSDRNPDGTFAPGHTGGRPRGSKSIVKALRRVVSVDEIANILWAMATSADVKNAKWAIDTILNRLEGRSVTRSLVSSTHAHVNIALPAGFSEMSPQERALWADSIRAKALEGEVIDVDSDE